MRKQRKKTGNKKVHFLLLSFMIIGIIISALFPSSRKAPLYTANDISEYSSMSHIPDTIFLSNKKDTVLSFRLLEKELYAVCLYFRVSGVNGEKAETDGKVVASLLKGDHLLKTVEIPITELYHYYITSTLTSFKGKEIIFDLDGEQSGEFELSLRTEGMSEKTRISLLGANYVPEYICIKDQPNRLVGVLTVIETKQRRYPYTWYLILLTTLYFLSFITKSALDRRENANE